VALGLTSTGTGIEQRLVSGRAAAPSTSTDRVCWRHPSVENHRTDALWVIPQQRQREIGDPERGAESGNVGGALGRVDRPPGPNPRGCIDLGTRWSRPRLPRTSPDSP